MDGKDGVEEHGNLTDLGDVGGDSGNDGEVDTKTAPSKPISSKQAENGDRDDSFDAEVEKPKLSIEEVIMQFEGDLSQKALERVREIDCIRINNERNMSKLLTYLEEQHKSAREADKMEEEKVRTQGLILGVQIPVGSSNLDVDKSKMAQYGEFFNKYLVTARELLHKEMIAKSPSKETTRTVQQATKELVSSDAPGYLKDTAANKKRSQIMTQRKTMKSNTDIARATQRSAKAAAEADLDYDGLDAPAGKSKRNKKAEPMTGEEKALNEKLLARMNVRLNFQKNPRYDKSEDAVAKTSLLGTGEEQKGFWQYDKSGIKFNEYEMNKSYVGSIKVRNVSSVSRRFRVLVPNQAKIFKLIKVSQSGSAQSAEDGRVAPGMTVTCSVEFFPDSLGAYEDRLVFCTETEKLNIPITASREPPNLVFSNRGGSGDAFDCGCCLMGNGTKSEFEFRNHGGRGKFMLLPLEWATMEMSSLHEDRPLQCGSFTIAFQDGGTSISLDSNMVGTIHLDFLPTHKGGHTSQFVMVCDNCTSEVYEIIGLAEEVSLSIRKMQGKVVDLTGAEVRSYHSFFVMFDSCKCRQGERYLFFFSSFSVCSFTYYFVRTFPNRSSSLMFSGLPLKVLGPRSTRLSLS